MSDTHLEVPVKRAVRAVFAAAVVGVSLGVVGIHDAYVLVGFHSSAGHIITTAIGIAFGCVSLVTVWATYGVRRSKR